MMGYVRRRNQDGDESWTTESGLALMQMKCERPFAVFNNLQVEFYIWRLTSHSARLAQSKKYHFVESVEDLIVAMTLLQLEGDNYEDPCGYENPYSTNSVWNDNSLGT